MKAQTIRQLLASRALAAPERIFLLDWQHSLTYAQVHARVQAVASAVSAAGIQKGQSVGFAAGNSVDLAVCILGLFYGGFRATSINLVAGNETIGYVLTHSDCQLILQDDNGREVLGSVQQAAQIPRVDLSEMTHLPADPAQINALSSHAGSETVNNIAQTADSVLESLQSLLPEDDGLLMYTSGTTGRPKGVRLSHGNLIAGGNNTATAHQITADDRAICSLPLYHINALCVTLLAPLVSGGSVMFPPKFSTSQFWKNIQATDCTWFSLVPTQIGYLLNAKEEPLMLPKLRFGRSASAPLSPDIQAAFEVRFNVPIIETMGLTETAAQILSNPLPPGVRKIGSPGVAVGNEVKIVDEHNQTLAADTEGEICIRGSNVMIGYLNNEAATREAMDANGWLHTGDLGKLDSDGYVFVTGRIKELIIKGGENIAPREVDEALLSHPAILEAAAFAADCERYGQKVLAAAVLKQGLQVQEAELITHCCEKIGSFKTPQTIYLLDDLPKGPSGKVQRLKLAELIL